MKQKHSPSTAVRNVVSSADLLWPGRLDGAQKERLSALVEQHGFSPASGDLTLIDRNWYVTHSGLLRLARKNHCSGIQTETVSEFCDPRAQRWVVKATVYKSPRSKGFVGYGDADPSNVSPLVRGAEMRIAETRAVNRALRKAYGIGLCSVEELGAGTTQISQNAGSENGHDGKGQPRLRDRLLLLIRQHQLDSAHIKRYAAHFCGTSSLREASREQVEKFVAHLASRAAGDREQLIAEMAALFDSPEEPNPEQAGDRPDHVPNNKEAA